LRWKSSPSSRDYQNIVIAMYSVGVYGSATAENDQIAAKARHTGQVLARYGCRIITGACSGLPYLAAAEAFRAGREVWGFSPVSDRQQQQAFVPDDDLTIYSRLIYLPEWFEYADNLNVAKKYRNVISTAHCDAGIIIAGAWGTLHEFCSLIDYGKVAGVLTRTGGIADMLPYLHTRIPAPSDAAMLFDADPDSLVERVVAALELRRTGQI
jgi:predicted Rossmann-fold nucleotide-binding protein